MRPGNSKQDGGYLRYELHWAIKKWSVAVSASKVLQIGSWAIHGNATQDMHKVWDLWKEMAIRSVLSIGECVLTVKQQFFLDTQMSLAPTHVRCKSVRPSVRPSVILSDFLFCQRLWSPYVKNLKLAGWGELWGGRKSMKIFWAQTFSTQSLTLPKLFQTERTRRLACLPSFCELVLSRQAWSSHRN